MGLAIDASKRAYEATTDNLTFVAVAFAVTILIGVLSLLLSIIPLIGPILSNVLVAPVLIAGIVAMAEAALDRRATLDDFTGGISEFWKSMVGAYGIMYVAMLGVFIGLAVVFALIGTFTMGLGGASGMSPGAGASGMDPAGVSSLFAGLGLVFLGVVLLLALVAVVVALAIQFLPAAVVVGRESATSSFGACWRLLRRQPLAVLGYTLVLVGVWVAAVVAIAILYGVGLTLGDELVGIALAGIVGLVVYPFAQAFFFAYQASFYRAASTT